MMDAGCGCLMLERGGHPAGWSREVRVLVGMLDVWMLDAGAWSREVRVLVGMNGRSSSRGSAGVVVGHEQHFREKEPA